MMNTGEARVTTEAARFLEVREKLVHSLGVHSVNILLDRAIFEASRRHSPLALIERDGDAVSFKAVGKAYAGRPEEEVADAFQTLTSELLLLLGRLLGREVAERLIAQLIQEDRGEAKPLVEGRGGIPGA